jgi:hypothetical protein
VPNHAPDGTQVDNHDILTVTNDEGHVGSGGGYDGFYCFALVP